MSKGLEALSNLYARASVHCPIDEIELILDMHEDIEKELKALEIIRKKKFIHNDILVAVGKDKEEYELLKEVLE